MDELKLVYRERPSFIDMAKVHARYDIDPLAMTGEAFLYQVS